MTSPDNDIDRFMSLSPPLSKVDLDDVIKYHRAQRAKRERGEKSDAPEFDISKLFKPKVVEQKPSIGRRPK